MALTPVEAAAVGGDWWQAINGQGNPCRSSYPLVVVVGWRQRAGGGGGSQRVKESGPDGSSRSPSYATYFPCSPPVMEATQRHANPWNIIIIFMDVMDDDVGEHALTSVRASTSKSKTLAFSKPGVGKKLSSIREDNEESDADYVSLGEH